jgi:SAM-dependent methyltransferase
MNTNEILKLYEDAQLYDDQNADVTEDLSFWSTIVETYADPGKPILELGAGSGRVTLPLCDLGYSLIGIDLSESMLNLASSKYQLLTNPDRGVCSFIPGDIRTYVQSEPLPLVIFPYNSISHLTTQEDLQSFFHQLHQNLLPDGRFVFTVFVPLPAFLSRDPSSLYPVGSFKNSISQKQIDLFESMSYDRTTQVNHITWYFFEDHKEDPYITKLSLRMFYPQELTYLLHYYGFEIEHRYGDYDFSEFDKDSVVQCIVARKRI